MAGYAKNWKKYNRDETCLACSSCTSVQKAVEYIKPIKPFSQEYFFRTCSSCSWTMFLDSLKTYLSFQLIRMLHRFKVIFLHIYYPIKFKTLTSPSCSNQLLPIYFYQLRWE